VDRYEKKLSDDGIDIEEIRASVKEEIEKETEWALEQPMPDPATARDGVFADSDPVMGDGNAPWSFWKQEAGNA
jgi:TPP-dependent pyruvate/acetoin dehydrogenase alpha subunit